MDRHPVRYWLSRCAYFPGERRTSVRDGPEHKFALSAARPMMPSCKVNYRSRFPCEWKCRSAKQEWKQPDLLLRRHRRDLNGQRFGRIPLGGRFHLVYARFQINGQFFGCTRRQWRGKGAFEARPRDLEPSLLGSNVGHFESDDSGVYAGGHFHVCLSQRNIHIVTCHRLLSHHVPRR